MSKPIEHFVFFCRGTVHGRDCRMPLTLPVDALKRQFPNLEVQPTDDCPVGLVCLQCKHVNIYSPVQNSPYFDPDAHSKLLSPTGDTECLSQLRCEGGNCEFRAPLFATWSADTTTEEKEKAVRTWKAEGLHAPDGHPILLHLTR
jgi:hypothetical protein